MSVYTRLNAISHNLDSFVKKVMRLHLFIFSDVYAIDLPGFARSSRNKFSSDPDTAERQFVEALERWRQTVGIEKMNLLGHRYAHYIKRTHATCMQQKRSRG